MKRFKTKTMRFLSWALLMIAGISVQAQTWTWTGETPAAGNSYYIYTVNQKKFLNDNNGLDSSPTILWTIGGTFSSNYTLTSSNSKQFAMYRSGSIGNRVYNVVTNATGQSGDNVNLESALSDGKYSIYRQSKTGSNWSGDRNVVSTSTGITRQSDASYEWKFITQDQVNARAKYITAWNTLSPCAGEKPISLDLKNRIAEALTAEVNYSNYGNKINEINTLVTEYNNYITSLATATKASPKDVSGLIKNPGYEASTWDEGWTATNFVKQNNGNMTANYAEMWSGDDDLTSGKISQTLTGLLVGTYLLSATVTGGFVGETSMYAMDEARKVTVPGIDKDPVQHPVVPFVVHNESEGASVEFGFKRDNCQYWTAVDDWTLSYYPTDEYEWVNGTRLDGSYLSKPAYTSTPMEGVDDTHANDALLVITWRDNYTNDVKTPWALVPGSKAEVWTDGAKTADVDLLSDFRSSHYTNGFGLYIPNFDETKTYTVKVPENVFGYTSVGHGNEAFEVQAVASPLKDGKYFVVVKGTGKHVSRGKGWGTQAILDYYGVPMMVQTAGLTVFKFLDNNAFLGSDPTDDWLYTDIQGSESHKVRRYILIPGEGEHAGEFQFYAPSREKYLSHVQNSINGETYDAVNEGEQADYFQFEVLDKKGYKAHLATIEEDEAIRVAAHAGFVVKSKTEYDALINTWESKGYTEIFPAEDATAKEEAAAYHEKKNEELACDAIWEGTPRNLVTVLTGEKDEDGKDIEEDAHVSLTLNKGLYVMYCDAFQQAMALSTLQVNQGFRGLTYMYVKVGSEMYKSQLKSITETTGGIPTDDATAKTALDAGTYRTEVLFYVPADGTNVEFGVENPQRLGNGVDETAGSWVAFKNIKVEKFNAEMAEANMKVAAGKFGTFIAPFAVKMPAGVTAYSGTLNGEHTSVALTSEAAEGTELEACTPVVVYNNSTQDVDMTFRDVDVRDVKTTITEKKGVFVGFYKGYTEDNAAVIQGDGSSWVLQTQNDKQAFYKVEPDTQFKGVKNRCYLVAPTASYAKVLNITFDEEETGIEFVETDGTDMGNKTIYDLSGRKVSNTMRPGIYILNGKKFIVK